MPFGAVKKAASSFAGKVGDTFGSVGGTAATPFGWQTAGTAALTGGLDLAGTYLTNEANAKQAEENRKFQERMSNTAIRRRVRDLRKAGINPILAAELGATTPGGAQAVMQNVIGSGVSSAKDTIMKINQVRQLQQAIATSRAQETKENALADQSRAQAENIRLQTVHSANDLARSEAEKGFWETVGEQWSYLRRALTGNSASAAKRLLPPKKGARTYRQGEKKAPGLRYKNKPNVKPPRTRRPLNEWNIR